MKFKNRVRKALSERSRDESLSERGIDGTAVVNSVKKSLFSAGDDDNTERIYKYSLRVTVPGREPYEVAHTETIHVAAGQTVPVKVDPDDPENLLIDWQAIKAQTTAKWTQVTEANMQRVTQFSPSTLDAKDPALEPIEGITLERYAELTVARVKQGITTEAEQNAWLKTQGVEPSAWQTASDGWAKRMAAQPALTMQYATLYQRAASA